MIVLSFVGSVEFYVILFTVAAAIVGLCVRPAEKGEATTYILQGKPLMTDGDHAPALTVRCRADGSAAFVRSGMALDSDAEVSYMVTRRGFDLLIEEHIVSASHAQPLIPTTVEFTLGNLAPERYHVRFESRQSSLTAIFTLTVRDGFTASRPLHH